MDNYKVHKGFDSTALMPCKRKQKGTWVPQSRGSRVRVRVGLFEAVGGRNGALAKGLASSW
jgi:hypothetical protein